MSKELAGRLEAVRNRLGMNGGYTVGDVETITKAVEALRSLSAEPRPFGTEPRGCPTPGACSCPQSAPSATEPSPFAGWTFEPSADRLKLRTQFWGQVKDENGQLVAYIGEYHARAMLAATRPEERDIVLSAIDDEPELPGSMPYAMWESMRTDKDAAEQAMRIAVKQTKDGIRARYLAAIGLDMNRSSHE